MELRKTPQTGREFMSTVRKPYIVGITGGIACGKTTATEHLQSLGALVLDADVESRALTASGGAALPAIRERFGDEVFHEDGTLNRQALGRIVFSDINQRHALEAITHPMIQHKMISDLQEAERNGETVVFLSVPLLYETGMDALCDETWVLSVDRETQIKRLQERDGMEAAEAEKRIDSQMDPEERNAKANVVIRSGRSIEQTRAELGSLYRDLKKRIS